MALGKLVQFDGESFNLLPVVGVSKDHVRPIEALEQDIFDAYETCRRNCSGEKMDECERNGKMPGMPGCRKK